MRPGSYKTPVTILIPLVLFALVPLVFSQSMRPDEPKRDGTTRVGLVTPRVTLIGGGGSVPQETATLQKNISSYLSGPRIGTVNIRAKLDALSLEEAKERECDFVIFISLTRKRRLGPKGTTSGFGSGTKAGDEYNFEYKVVPIAGGNSKDNTLKGTVTADGDDVLTSMIETMAQVVVELARTSRPVQSTASASGPGSTDGPSKIKTESHLPPPENEKSPENPKPPAGYGSLTALPRTSANRIVNDPPKAAGTIRIGFVIPRVLGGGMNTSSGDAAALRKTISSYLEGSTIESIELKARLEGLILTEAQKRDCDYVLYTTLTRKRKTASTGGFGLSSILGNTGGMGSKVPGTKTASEIGSQVSKVSGGIASLSKANDEMKFEYKLVTSDGGRTLVEKATVAKVKTDGDDVLSPMIESAAQAIVDATKKN